MPTPSSPPLLYLEDLAVGDTFVSPTYALDAQQIVAFATQFDPQPFHMDAQAAQNTFFGGLAASGWHTMGITMRLLVQSFPLAQGLIGASAQLHWPQPTRPDDVLQVTSTIQAIAPSRSKPDRAIVEVECITRNQHGAPLQKLVCKVVAFKKPQ